MKLLALPSRCGLGTTLAVACLALLLCAPAHAGNARRTGRQRAVAAAPAKPVAPPIAQAPATPAGAAGMVIAIDPETGALVAPSAEQARALAAAQQLQSLSAAERTGLMRTSEGLTEVRRPDGSAMLDLQGRFMEFSVVQLDRTGCPHFFCVGDEVALRALLSRLAPVSAPALEER